jgi:hypothetical protein
MDAANKKTQFSNFFGPANKKQSFTATKKTPSIRYGTQESHPTPPSAPWRRMLLFCLPCIPFNVALFFSFLQTEHIWHFLTFVLIAVVLFQGILSQHSVCAISAACRLIAPHRDVGERALNGL